MFRKLCGDDSLKNVLIVTNMWNEVSLAKGIAREAELRTDDLFFKPALDKGAQLVRHTATAQSARTVLRLLVKKQPAVLNIQREIVDEGMDITQTPAGLEVDRHVAALIAKHQQELAQIREEMAAAIEAKDSEARKELHEVRQRLESEVIRLAADRDTLSRQFEEEMARAEVRSRCLGEELERERNSRAEVQADINNLLRELSSNNKATEEQRAELLRQIEWLQQQKAQAWHCTVC